MRTKIIDSHCHLDAREFDAERERLMTEARQCGVGGFVVPAVGALNFDQVAGLSREHDDVCHAYGIHPLFVQQAQEVHLDLLEQRLGEGTAVAVGEIGLDHFVSDVDPALQTHFYVAQLKLARRFGLPVILHVRRAVDAILKQLRRIEVPGGIAHAFNGSRQQAEIFIRMGFKLGFGGAATFEGSRRIRRLASELPLDALVLETDAPDIPPQWAQGGRNEPANICRYAQIIADLRGMPVDELIAATARNTLTAFPAMEQQLQQKTS